MNIFFLDRDPELCAQYHCNKHLVKMILEHVQMLSTVNRLNGLDEGYRAGWANHPCTIWAGTCIENWMYVRDLTFELQKEMFYRGFNPHSSIRVLENLSIPNLPKNGCITEPAQAMPSYCRDNDAVVAYRNYYIKEKQHLAKWGY